MNRRSEPFQHDLSAGSALFDPRSDWMDKIEKKPGLNGCSLKYPRSKAIGVSSAINPMISIRGQGEDYDSPHQIRVNGWSWKDYVLPVFKRVDEWRAEEPRLHRKVLSAIEQAAVQMGVSRSQDFNTDQNTGVGYFHVNQSPSTRRVRRASLFLSKG